MQDTVQSILKFWFEEISPKQWDVVNPAFDFEISERFSLAYDLALDGLCDEWQGTVNGTLAYVLLMGVFPHYMYRGEYKAFDGAAKAAQAGRDALCRGYDQVLSPAKRKFFYAALLNSDHKEDLMRAVNGCAAIQNAEPVAHRRAQRALAAFCGSVASFEQSCTSAPLRKEPALVYKN
jgi:uncharacterized protein (DUF924 family)